MYRAFEEVPSGETCRFITGEDHVDGPYPDRDLVSGTGVRGRGHGKLDRGRLVRTHHRSFHRLDADDMQSEEVLDS